MYPAAARNALVLTKPAIAVLLISASYTPGADASMRDLLGLDADAEATQWDAFISDRSHLVKILGAFKAHTTETNISDMITMTILGAMFPVEMVYVSLKVRTRVEEYLTARVSSATYVLER